jgi:hypothetical protein
MFKTLILAVLLLLDFTVPALAHGHHHGGYHGPIIIGGPILVPYPYPYPVPVPVCVTVPGQYVWDGYGWVWVPAHVEC